MGKKSVWQSYFRRALARRLDDKPNARRCWFGASHWYMGDEQYVTHGRQLLARAWLKRWAADSASRPVRERDELGQAA